MTKKWMLGIFLASFLLLTNLALAAESSSPGPAVTKMDLAPSDCGCLKKDKAPASPGVKADVLVENPSHAERCPPWGHYVCWYSWIPGQGLVYRCACYVYPRDR